MTTKFIKIANQHKTEFEYFLKNIFPVVMIWEGGGKLHNVAGDAGSWTIWGIAYNYNKQHFDGLEDHKNTTKEEAAAFAFVNYYLPLKPAYLCGGVKLMAFDTAYNMGVSRAIKYIQECAGVKADGIIGNQTRSAMSKVTIDCLFKKRKAFYGAKSTSKFYKGWMNRLNDVTAKSRKL